MDNDRYKQAMIPALIMGILTNIYIALVLIYVGANGTLFSPITGGLIFIGLFLLLKRDIINSKQAFLITGYSVAIEIWIHTHVLGWNAGFVYYIFLLPTVFLLNSKWKTWMVVLFNSSIGLLTILLLIIYGGSSPSHPIAEETRSIINMLNITATGVIVFVVMIYFSRTINKKDEALIEANIELEQQYAEISGQHQRQQILLKEIHHRVKNNLQIISSLISLQGAKVKDKEVVSILNESRRRIAAIALIHKKLYQDSNLHRVDFKSYLEELMDSQQMMVNHLKYNVKSSKVMLNLDTAVPLGLIVSELVVNAIKHAFEGVQNPEINVTLNELNQGYLLEIMDNGKGLPKDFDLKNPSSLGTEIIVALEEQIQAKIEYSSQAGAKFSIQFSEQLADFQKMKIE